MISDVYNCDCLDFMRDLPDNSFDLVIADPPYDLPKVCKHGRGKLAKRILNNDEIKVWDKTPDKDFFKEIFRVSRNQIIWGYNYFDLPPTRCFIAWDKVQPWSNFSQVELAYTSFDMPSKLFRFDNRTGNKIHPTQKPVELYLWILRNFLIGGSKIFDPMMGSQSSRIAAYKTGIDYVGCEIREDYFASGDERFRRECLGEYKTGDGIIIKQLNLFE